MTTCNEAATTLRTLDLDAEISAIESGKLGGDVRDALRHYASCGECRPQGLKTFLPAGSRMNCVEALCAAIGTADLLFSLSSAKTLRDVIAHEHIYGTHVIRESDGWAMPPTSPVWGDGCASACKEQMCDKARQIWNTAPLCAHYDGDGQVTGGPSYVLQLAKEAGWDLEPFLTVLINRQRILGKELRKASRAKHPTHGIALALKGIKNALARFSQKELVV